MIHQYKLNGYNIVIDVYSGSVHSVDEVAYVRFAVAGLGIHLGNPSRKNLHRTLQRPRIRKNSVLTDACPVLCCGD